MRSIRPAKLCRSWLFLEGADERGLLRAPDSGADVLIQELEDFTPQSLRPKARSLAPEIYQSWREAGAVAAVRINPLDGDGLEDLAQVMRGRPDIVALPKVAEPQQIARLDQAVARFEREYGIAEGSTALLPNIEFARGLVQTAAIAGSSRRIAACLLASEDLAADLGAERGQDGVELAYCRQRFLVECVAAGVVAVDCPYTWSDAEGVERDTRWARSWVMSQKAWWIRHMPPSSMACWIPASRIFAAPAASWRRLKPRAPKARRGRSATDRWSNSRPTLRPDA